MDEIEREVRMLKNGILGNDVNLKELVAMDLVSQEACEIYLKDMGASNTKVAHNDNTLFISLKSCHAPI